VSTCPESVTGIHDNTDVQGRCLLCRRKIGAAMPFGPDSSARRQAARAQDPRSIDGPDEGDYLDGWDMAVSS
jgi:hypothetical protein